MNKSKRHAVILIGGALAAAVGGIALQALMRNRSPDDMAIANLWSLPLQDLEGNAQSLKQWKGKILVVNFWATWCEPCRIEIPALVRAQDKYASNGVQMLGISLDSASKVRDFAKDFRVQYPLVIGSLDSIEITRILGNKAAGLPYTVVLDAKGTIKARHLGGISETQLDEAILPLISHGARNRT